MESPNNTHIMLVDLGCLLKQKKAILEKTELQITSIKEEIREIMKINNKTTFDDDLVKIKLTRSYAFDTGLFKLENPEVAKVYISEETTTKIKDVVNKKGLMKYSKVLYEKYLEELTPKLRVT